MLPVRRRVVRVASLELGVLARPVFLGLAACRTLSGGGRCTEAIDTQVALAARAMDWRTRMGLVIAIPYPKKLCVDCLQTSQSLDQGVYGDRPCRSNMAFPRPLGVVHSLKLGFESPCSAFCPWVDSKPSWQWSECPEFWDWLQCHFNHGWQRYGR